MVESGNLFGASRTQKRRYQIRIYIAINQYTYTMISIYVMLLSQSDAGFEQHKSNTFRTWPEPDAKAEQSTRYARKSRECNRKKALPKI